MYDDGEGRRAMDIDDIRFLYEYHIWATGKILVTAGKISQEQFLAPVLENRGSIRKRLVHLLSAEWIWRSRCQEGVSPKSMLTESDFPTLGELRARWKQEQEAMKAYLGGLDNRALNDTIQYQRTDGSAQENILWHLLMQVINHGTQHRSEVAMALTEAGQSPGDLDFIVFVRGRKTV